jgi:hypothetical protein
MTWSLARFHSAHHLHTASGLVIGNNRHWAVCQHHTYTTTTVEHKVLDVVVPSTLAAAAGSAMIRSLRSHRPQWRQTLQPLVGARQHSPALFGGRRSSAEALFIK